MLPELLIRLERWLVAHRPGYAAQLAPPLDDAALDALEAQVGRALPAEVRALYAWHDGQRHSGWSLVGRFWLMPVEQLLVQRKENAEAADDLDDEAWWRDAWFPVLDDGMGNLLVVDAGGGVRMYFHDDPDRDVIAPDLAAVFRAVVEGMETGVLRAPAADEPWTGCGPTSEAAWTALREAHGVAIPLA